MDCLLNIISPTGGIQRKIKLQTIPRVGDLIDLDIMLVSLVVMRVSHIIKVDGTSHTYRIDATVEKPPITA